MAEHKGILTYCEITEGELPSISKEVLGCGRKLADDLGQILAGELRPSVDAYWIGALALVAIALLVWILRRTAKKAISRSRVS